MQQSTSSLTTILDGYLDQTMAGSSGEGAPFCPFLLICLLLKINHPGDKMTLSMHLNA